MKMTEQKITLVCLNPQGAVETAPPVGLSNPRVKDLAGKKIGIFWDGKQGGDKFCLALEEQLKEKVPAAVILRTAWGDVAAAEKAKKEVDAFIFGVGDSGMGGWGQCQQAVALEKQGIPGLFVAGDNAIHTTRMSLRDSGMPALRVVVLPSIDYYPNRATVEGLRPVVQAHIDQIVAALTSPLNEAEKNPALMLQKVYPEKIEIKAESYESALEQFNSVYLENHWGDGLPLIPPTEKAVKEMLKGASHSPDEKLGRVPFRHGLATVEKVAVNAVMAGARPEYLPVILAAVECLTEEGSFSHMMSSEGSFTLMIMVSGPLGREIGMNCGVGLLGHGFQANNTIGRAVRLCMINLGYLWPGEIDMALIGRPSSHTFYTLAENMEQSPWESFNEGLGYLKEDSCVTLDTVGGASGMGLRVFGGGVVEPWDVREVLETLVKEVARDRSIFAAYKMGVANPMAHLRKHILVIHPELAIMLQRIGYKTKRSLRDYLYENSRVPFEKLSSAEIKGIQERMNTRPGGGFFAQDAIAESQMPLFKEGLKPGGKVPVISPDDIHIVVSGSIPGYSFGMSYFRSAHMTKLIKGATLTKAGR
jgi:hypothetical protein